MNPLHERHDEDQTRFPRGLFDLPEPEHDGALVLLDDKESEHAAPDCPGRDDRKVSRTPAECWSRNGAAEGWNEPSSIVLHTMKRPGSWTGSR